MPAPHRFDIRVYYEDTDAGGVVYYANYLKFTERARTEWLRAIGVDHGALREDHGLIFVVARIDARYRRPARLDDLLTVETVVNAIGAARVTLAQTALRDGEILFDSKVDVALIDFETGRPARAPAALNAKLRAEV
ncbi:MAG: tol-pal system-associated acyl-CoA thioesterase [Pseudomonadota bacterium]